MPGKEKEFQEPISLEEGEARRIQLTQDVEGIEAQLGDRNRTDETGNRMSSAQYWAWRKKAQHSLRQKLGELRVLKSWLRTKRAEQSSSIAANLPPALLEEALCLLEQILPLAKSPSAVTPSSDAQTKLDAAQSFVDRVRAGERNAD